MDPRHAILFEPVRIGPKTLRNRFYQVPHCTGFGTIKPLTQARHRAIKAEGGWAAVNTEYAPITHDTDEGPYIGADVWRDEDLRALERMTAEAHEHGALAGIELHHAGAHASNATTRWHAIAPSQIASDSLPDVTPKAMERSDIRRVQAAWAERATLARSVGFDIVYVYGGHSFLPAQFLSPFYNRRTDEYGGSLENRARFWLEALEQVRGAVGDDTAVAVRLAIDALGPEGVDVDETLAFLRMADHLVDLWDVNVGSISGWVRDSGPSRFWPEGYQMEFTSRAREATAKPIVGVARWSNPDAMAEAVRSGAIDLVGSARQSIADPFLPRKVEEGRLDDVRECTGSNVCIGKYMHAFHLGCIQNATVGEEHRRGWHPERFAPVADPGRDVLIVGAGPAGLEAAITLARRGVRRVHLAEAAAEVGGHMRWVPRLPGLGEWGRVINWRTVQLRKLRRQIELLTSTELTADDVRDYGADLVILATGSSWAGDGLNFATRNALPGADPSLAAVLTPEQVMLEGKRPPGKGVVVYDADGSIVGAGLAELLADEGHAVSLVTPFSVVAPQTDHSLEGPLLRRRLFDHGVAMHLSITVEELGTGGVRGATEYDEPFELACDGVVLVTQRRSDDALYHALAGASAVPVYRIGDCVSPRQTADAIFDGHRLGREIESSNPQLPEPTLPG